MAEPISTTGAIILGAAQLAGAGANAYAQGKQNKKTRKWNEKMYAQQYADNLKNWHLQNDYNKPINQINRLKEAGLNPMLMQGDANLGMANAQASGADVKSWNPTAPQIDPQTITAPLNAVLTQRQIENTGASTSNTQAHTAKTQIDILHERLKIAKTADERDLIQGQITNLQHQDDYLVSQSAFLASQKALNEFDLKLKEDLRTNTIDMATATLRSINAGISRTFSDIALNSAKTSESYAAARLSKALTSLNEANFVKVMAEVGYIGAQTNNVKANTENQKVTKYLLEAQTKYTNFQSELNKLDQDLRKAQTANEIQRLELEKQRMFLQYADFIKTTVLDIIDINSKDYTTPARPPIGFGSYK